jgi:hypothetical protein
VLQTGIKYPLFVYGEAKASLPRVSNVKSLIGSEALASPKDETAIKDGVL